MEERTEEVGQGSWDVGRRMAARHDGEGPPPSKKIAYISYSQKYLKSELHYSYIMGDVVASPSSVWECLTNYSYIT